MLNGTVNYILDRLHKGFGFDEALAQARAAGFAEEDPSSDLSGADAAAKLKLIAAAAFGVDPASVAVETETLDAARAEAIRASRPALGAAGAADAATGREVALVPAAEAEGLPALPDEWNARTSPARTASCCAASGAARAARRRPRRSLRTSSKSATARRDRSAGFRSRAAGRAGPLRRAATRARLVGAADAPVIVALGGISANRFVADDGADGPGWWGGLIGPGRAIDPARWRILGLDFAADESGAPPLRPRTRRRCLRRRSTRRASPKSMPSSAPLMAA